MRKTQIFVVAIALMLTSASAFAQDDTAMEPEPAVTVESQSALGNYVGVTGLLNYSNISFAEDNDAEPDSKLGFGGGVRGIFEFHEYVGLQPEVLFKQYGYSMDFMGADMSVTANYLEVPVLARITLPMGGMVTPKLLVGPSFGYFLSSSAEVDGEELETEDSDDTSSLQIGVAAGIGADIAAGPGLFNIDLRYDRALTSANDDDIDENDVYNTGFGLMLGYSIAL